MDHFRLLDPAHEALRVELMTKRASPKGACGYFTKVFAERFPELTRVPGYYFAPGGEVSYGEHWWLTDAAGNIVDPTADQFPSCGQGIYVPYDANRHIMHKGTCPGCGAALFAFFRKPCSLECAEWVGEDYGCEPSSGPFEVDMVFSSDAELARKYGVELPLPG